MRRLFQFFESGSERREPLLGFAFGGDGLISRLHIGALKNLQQVGHVAVKIRDVGLQHL